MATTKQAKPERPYPEFPLFPHAAGVWAKKIKGKLHYFGPWGGPDAALAKYRREVDDLQAGRTPRASLEDRLTLREAANHYLRSETSAWSEDVNTTQRGVDWQMKIDDARCKLKSVYPKIKL